MTIRAIIGHSYIWNNIYLPLNPNHNRRKKYNWIALDKGNYKAIEHSKGDCLILRFMDFDKANI